MLVMIDSSFLSLTDTPNRQWDAKFFQRIDCKGRVQNRPQTAGQMRGVDGGREGTKESAECDLRIHPTSSRTSKSRRTDTECTDPRTERRWSVQRLKSEPHNRHWLNQKELWEAVGKPNTPFESGTCACGGAGNPILLVMKPSSSALASNTNCGPANGLR
jgi:hypothetical protein